MCVRRSKRLEKSSDAWFEKRVCNVQPSKKLAYGSFGVVLCEVVCLVTYGSTRGEGVLTLCNNILHSCLGYLERVRVCLDRNWRGDFEGLLGLTPTPQPAADPVQSKGCFVNQAELLGTHMPRHPLSNLRSVCQRGDGSREVV